MQIKLFSHVKKPKECCILLTCADYNKVCLYATRQPINLSIRPCGEYELLITGLHQVYEKVVSGSPLTASLITCFQHICTDRCVNVWIAWFVTKHAHSIVSSKFPPYDAVKYFWPDNHIKMQAFLKVLFAALFLCKDLRRSAIYQQSRSRRRNALVWRSQAEEESPWANMRDPPSFLTQ